MLMLEIIAYYSMKNKDLFDVLEDIYEKYGYYLEIGESIVLKGIEGKEKITNKMDTLRKEKLEIMKKMKSKNQMYYIMNLKMMDGLQ